MRRAAAAPPELPGLSYQRLLGSGGFADVFLYEQAFPKRMVAVKVLLADDLTPATRNAFVGEANLMAQLSAHPFIVSIFGADISADGRPYLMMEYCSGPSLSEQYKRRPLSVEDALRTGIRISGAVATAHAAGVLHRDIKPANILTNDFGWPALTDFGIASALEEELPLHTTSLSRAVGDTSATSSAGTAVGLSIPWSPAEMFTDDPDPDVRSDVFSLAATVYTLLAGHTPFEVSGRSNGALDLIGRIERGVISPIGRADLSRTLTAVLNKGMATRREDRYATAVDFGRALQRIEMELGYAPTALDVPNAQRVPTAEDFALHQQEQQNGGDETEIRSVATINAQPSAPAAPTGTSAPWTPLPVVGADETEIRSAPQQVQAQADVEQTMLRAPLRPAPAPQFGAPPPPPQASGPAPRKSKLGVILGSAAALVVAAVIVVAVTLGGGVDPDPTPTATTTDPNVIVKQLEAPDVVAQGRSDGAVIFTLINPSFVEGDYFRVQVVGGAIRPASESKQTDTLTFTVENSPEVVSMSIVCIDVSIVRDGKTSDQTRRCENETS